MDYVSFSDGVTLARCCTCSHAPPRPRPPSSPAHVPSFCIAPLPLLRPLHLSDPLTDLAPLDHPNLENDTALKATTTHLHKYLFGTDFALPLPHFPSPTVDPAPPVHLSP